MCTMSSCFKEVLKTDHPPASDSTTLHSPDSTTQLLTSQIWVYYEYFDYFDSVQASLVWKRNPLKDSLNLALNQVKFNADSTYWEIDQNGDTLKGEWQYTDGEKGMVVYNSEGSFPSTIQVLTSQRFEWLGSWAGNNRTYGVMVPKNQTIDSTGDRMTLITAHTWVYQEYFYNFGQAVPSLVWKGNLSKPLFNLSLAWVKFNTDGTYSEADQNGTLYDGTWTFTNGQSGTQVNNILGTFNSNIVLLDSTRFEWYDGVNHYGEMVLQ